MSLSAYNKKISRLETEIAGLKKKDSQERNKAAKEREAAYRRLAGIGDRTPRKQRLAKEADAARFERRATGFEVRAAAFEEQLRKSGAELRRAKTRLRRAQDDSSRHSAHPVPAMPKVETPIYDVCLTFADEQRTYVSKVAAGLRDRDYRVFYDGFESTRIWGGHMTERFDHVFRKGARRCVPFISAEYARKDWTKFEWRSALNRALEEDGYLLPARFDDTEMPGLPPSVGYIDLNLYTPEAFVDLVAEKLGPPS
jgi:hypothetical protein